MPDYPITRDSDVPVTEVGVLAHGTGKPLASQATGELYGQRREREHRRLVRKYVLRPEAYNRLKSATAAALGRRR